MQLVTEFSQFEQGSSTRRVKSRSKACLHCRRRKMRCDGVKPSCFQCVRAERAIECEYDDGISKTSTQLLYERLAMLEKRYRDLQAAKRTSQNRKAPSAREAPTASTFGTDDPKVNLSRSNSAPNRVHVQPGIAGDGPYEQSVSSSVISQYNSHCVKSSGYSRDRSAPGSTYVNGGMHTPSTRRFEIPSTTFSSHSGTHSGRSTPSTSDFSNNEAAFHPKYAFTYGYQPSSASEKSTSFPYDDAPQHEIGIPLPVTQHQPSPDLLLDFDDNGGVTPAMMEHLIDHFVAHSYQAGSPLLSSRIMDLLAFTTHDITSSLACAMNSILLVGTQFSPIGSIRALKHRFLRDTLATLPPLLSMPLDVAPDWKNHGRTLGREEVRDDRFNVVVATNISTMLATYFFSEGRYIEGAYHANTAARLALCSGLHHTPDPRLLIDSPSNAGLLFDSRREAKNEHANSGSLIPFPATVHTALERQHVFWNLFVLDRAWTAAGRIPASGSRWGAVAGAAPTDILRDRDPRTAVSTPWPEDWGLLILEEPEGEVPPPSPFFTSASTIEDFLTGVDTRPTQSLIQLRAKSAALFEAASRIALLYDPYEPRSGYDAPFATLQDTISNFIKILPQLPKRGVGHPSFSKSLPYTIHTIAHASIIRLYSKFADKAYKEGYCDNSTSLFCYSRDTPESSVQMVSDVLLGYERAFSNTESTRTDHSHARSVGMACAAVDQCLSSARETVRIADCIAPEDFSFLEAIIAPCWAFAGEILLRELKRVWSIPHASSRAGLLSDIRVLKASLNHLGSVFPIGNIEAHKIAEALSRITSSSSLSVP